MGLSQFALSTWYADHVSHLGGHPEISIERECVRYPVQRDVHDEFRWRGSPDGRNSASICDRVPIARNVNWVGRFIRYETARRSDTRQKSTRDDDRRAHHGRPNEGDPPVVQGAREARRLQVRVATPARQ